MDKIFEGFTVLHISDLHAGPVGSDMELWQSLLKGKAFQAVVMTGDMVGSDGNYEPMLTLIHTLKQLKPEAPVYFVAGDDDPAPVVSTPRGTPEVLADWVLAAQQEGAIYLDAHRTAGGRQARRVVRAEYLYDVDAAGMVKSLTKQKEEYGGAGPAVRSGGRRQLPRAVLPPGCHGTRRGAQQEMLSTDLQIAVTHVPLIQDYIRTSLEWADEEKVFSFRTINLLLAGHYCGGQWRVPGMGALYVPDIGWLPPDDGLMGMQRVNSINQYISGGLGASEAHPLKDGCSTVPA